VFLALAFVIFGFVSVFDSIFRAMSHLTVNSEAMFCVLYDFVNLDQSFCINLLAHFWFHIYRVKCLYCDQDLLDRAVLRVRSVALVR